MRFRAKKLSQHFLVAPEFLEEIAELLPLRNELVLEIGAGTGSLTLELAKRARKVVAVEIDEKLFPALQKRLRGFDNVEVICADALSLDFSPYKFFCGAIPYHISSPLLFKILSSNFKHALLVLQAEFGQRLVAQPGSSDWSRLSAMTQALCETRIIDFIPAICFSPPPKVDSVIAHLQAKPPTERLKLDAALVNALFQHKNKSVRKALLHSQRALGASKTTLNKFVSSLSPALARKRVRILSLREMEDLSKELNGSGRIVAASMHGSQRGSQKAPRLQLGSV